MSARSALLLLLLVAGRAHATEVSHGPHEEPVLALDASAGDAEGVVHMKLGERHALTALGPVVVTKECTLRRIENWAEKLPHEQEAIVEGLRARNAQRRAACAEALGAAAEDEL